MINNQIELAQIAQNAYCYPAPPKINDGSSLFENNELFKTLYLSMLYSKFLIQQNNGLFSNFPQLFDCLFNYRYEPFILQRIIYEYNRQELLNQLNTVRNIYNEYYSFNSIFGLNNINNNFNNIINNYKLESILNINTDVHNSEEIDNLFNLDKKNLVYFNDIDMKDGKKYAKLNINKNFKDSDFLYNLNTNDGYYLNNQNESLENQINTKFDAKYKKDLENKKPLIEKKMEKNIIKNQKTVFFKTPDETLINEKIFENKKSNSGKNHLNIFFPSNTSEKATQTNFQEKTKYNQFSFKNRDKIFKNETTLKKHIYAHIGEKLFICKYLNCNKSFNHKGNFKKHEKIHYNAKRYICNFPYCGKKFSENYNLKIHYCCHNNESLYKCNYPNCGKSFIYKGNLKYHEKNTHAIKYVNYSCEHTTFNVNFETKKEKLLQNYQAEINYFNEQKKLIKLIQKYKRLLFEIILNKKIYDEKDEKVLMLEKKFKEIEEKLIDQDKFKYYNDVNNNEIMDNIE